ncbi:F0F1 ATP synthase, F1 complex subunit delta [[Mycoplasma] cavipharyngis]|uniref:ATP synthase F1 subunit delta n=1 Tax=[Mycoplasma] cavipharyngis TaxID=92757 RepID=UPI003704BCD1
MRKYIFLYQQFAQAILSFFNDQASLEKVNEQNHRLLSLLQNNPEIVNIFTDFSIIASKKITYLEAILAVEPYDQYYVNGLKLFLDHGHGYFFLDLIETIDAQVLNKLNMKLVQVESAYPLTDQQKSKLEAGWSKKYQERLVFNYQVVPEMVLGINIRVDDYVEEYSLQSQLKNLQNKIKKIVN